MDKELFGLNSQLKILARILLMEILYSVDTKDSDFSPLHLFPVAFYYKAVDLFDGILQLQKLDLFEDAQILIRSLFETNLNYGFFVRLSEEEGFENACKKVFYSLIIMKKKDAILQEKVLKEAIWTSSELEKIVVDIELEYDDEYIKKIKKHGFTGMNIEQRARLDDKVEWYHSMYRNFSRNAHANDLVEYLVKSGIDVDNDFRKRNFIALMHSHLCLRQMYLHIGNMFQIEVYESIKNIDDEFKKITSD